MTTATVLRIHHIAAAVAGVVHTMAAERAVAVLLQATPKDLRGVSRTDP